MKPGRLVVGAALTTAALLVGGTVLGGILGSLVHAVAAPLPPVGRVGLATSVALALTMVGGAWWGRAMGRLAGGSDDRRMGWAGAVGFGVIVIVVALVLSGLEPVLVGGLATGLALHHVFTVAFGPAFFLVAAGGGLAVGVALRDRPLAVRLALRSGLSAAVAFLAVDLIMDALGWRVGAPGAARRATMVTVTSLGALAAALAAGTVIGRSLVARRAAA